MPVNLKKGQKVSLTKDNAGLSSVVVGLGWDEVQKKGLLGGLFGGGQLLIVFQDVLLTVLFQFFFCLCQCHAHVSFFLSFLIS